MSITNLQNEFFFFLSVLVFKLDYHFVWMPSLLYTSCLHVQPLFYFFSCIMEILSISVVCVKLDYFHLSFSDLGS